MREMIETRIPLWVESPRGDDRFGTNLDTGAIISDHDAKTQGIPFQQGIPQTQIQKAVEIQLQQDKWVCIEKYDGSTELLTKKDLPKLYPAPVISEPPKPQVTPKFEQPKEQPQPPKEQPKPNDDWKTAFSVNPVNPEPAKAEPVKPPVVPPVKSNQTCTDKPKNKEVWESKFENIKSATATHKGKGG